MSSENTIQLNEAVQLVPVHMEDQIHLLRLMRRIYLPVYHHLWKDSGDHYLEKTFGADNLEKELEEEESAYYFVLSENKLSGIIRIRRATPLKGFATQNALKLHRIYLDPQIHGQGIGQELMNWVKAEAKRCNASLVWLESMDTQEAALGFYRKNGFQVAENFTLEAKNVRPSFAGMIRMYCPID